jgi:hypothetical protein
MMFNFSSHSATLISKVPYTSLKSNAHNQYSSSDVTLPPEVLWTFQSFAKAFYELTIYAA